MEVLQLQAQLAEVTTTVSVVSNELKSLRNFLALKFGLELEKFLEESQISLRVGLGDIPNDTTEASDVFLSGDLQNESHETASSPSISSPRGKFHRRSLRKRKLPSASEVEVVGSSETNNNGDSFDEAVVSNSTLAAEEDSEECLKVDSVCSLSSQDEEVEKTEEVSRGRRDPEELRNLVELHVEKTHRGMIMKSENERRSSAGQRRSYTMQFKKAVLKYRETHSGEETARLHGITASTLRGWRRQQMEIAAATEGKTGDIKKRLKGGGRKRADGGQKFSEGTRRIKVQGDEEEVFSGQSSDEAGDDEEPEVQGELVELDNLLSSA